VNAQPLAVENAADEFGELLRAARSGSLKARGELLMGYRLYLLRIADRELGGPLRAKACALDMVQETFQDAHRDFDQFEGETAEELRGWLRRILRHNLSNFVRRYQATGKRRLASEVPMTREYVDGRLTPFFVPEETVPRSVLRAERVAAVRQALERLPEKDRQVVRWRCDEDRSFAEIGRLLCGSEDAARMRFNRAVQRLRGDLAPLC
jgi:RNA polymerase sigma-70 factor (ECF subfamily)